MDSSASEHVNQGVDAEEIDPTANQVTDPGLSHSKQPGRRSLTKTAVLDETPHGDHERRANPQVLGLIFAEAEIPEYIAAGWGAFCIHLDQMETVTGQSLGMRSDEKA